jgi:CRP-like cAMP-binding protein
MPAAKRPANRLLGSLHAADFARLAPFLEPLTLKYRQPLYDAGTPVEYVHFIDSGVASLVSVMRNGGAAEVGTVGNEGIVGLPVLLGSTTAPTTMYMQVPGSGHRMRADRFVEEMARSPALRLTALQYAHLFFNQVAQSGACAHFHNMEQRCCRWLLMTYDRSQTEEFMLTHEFLAMMLGVRRAGVSTVAGILKKAGLIAYARGRVRILDHAGLLKRSCECYAASKREFDEFLGESEKSIARRRRESARVGAVGRPQRK